MVKPAQSSAIPDAEDEPGQRLVGTNADHLVGGDGNVQGASPNRAACSAGADRASRVISDQL